MIVPAFLDMPHLISFAWSVARLWAWLALLVIIFVPLERLFSLRRQKFFRKSLAQDLGFYFVSGLVPGLLLSAPLALAAYIAHAFVPYSLQMAVASWPIWLRIAAGVVVGEIGFYWGHRLTHEIPFLWRFHAVHHSAEHVYFLTSGRGHPIDNVFTRLCGLVPVYVLGIGNPLTPSGSTVPALIMVMSVIWGFFIHANLRWRLGPLEWVIATPIFHHWHHTRTDHRDLNYAPMLPWIDWLFGTLYLPRHWPPSYGIEAKLPDSLAGMMLHPLRGDPDPTPLPEPLAAD